MSEYNNNQEIIIDEEFSRLLPSLEEHEYCSLEENILVYGCMNPLVLWEGILIDGHNRYSIVTKHNLPFNTISLEFNSRDEVIAWMIKTQLDRRNLSPMWLTYFRGLHYNVEKRIHGGDRHSQSFSSGQNDHLNSTTAKKLSDEHGVSPRTIRRDGEIADVIIAIGKESEDAKRSILSGETRISRKQLREMTSASEDEIAMTASEIAAGTFEDRVKAESSTLSEPGGANEKSPADSNQISSAIIKEANEFISKMQKLSQNANKAKMKTTMRTHIDNLEKLYKQI